MLNKALVLLLAFVGLSAAYSLGELVQGTFAYVNDTNLVIGPVYNNGPRGSVVYFPAYPGALYGNVSVNFGEIPKSNADSDVLSSFIAYAGAYEVDAVNLQIYHYPQISSKPAEVPVGSTVLRYFTMYENGNLLNLRTTPPANPSTLFWRRVFPLPGSENCQASVSLVARSGSGWTSNGKAYTIYDVTITNTGKQPILSVDVRLVPQQGDVENPWGLTEKGDYVYSYAVYNSLAAGASVTNAGFVSGGSGSLSLGSSVNAVTC